MDFLEKTCKERSKTEKVHIIIGFYMFEIGTKVQFKLKILNFRTKLTQKGYLRSKNRGKSKITIKFYMSELV